MDAAATRSGGKPLKVSGEVATPEQLAAATKIYETIGVYLGYATAQVGIHRAASQQPLQRGKLNFSCSLR